jgi:uncharacterized membrane protein SirB2
MSLALVSVSLFLFRSIRFLTLPQKNQFKTLSIGIDSLLTITGITQIIYLNYQPLNQYWFLEKMALLILYIFFGTQALQITNSKRQRISYLVIALITVFLISLLAINKPT